VVVANVRNVGTAAVSIEAIDFYFAVADEDPARQMEAAFLGRNDFGGSNPQLPYRLLDGDAVRWLMKMETVEMVTARTGALRFVGFRAQTRLGSGETVSSPQAALRSMP
jgi:hypothetical protein